MRKVHALVLFSIALAIPLAAQEHWTEGPVWSVSFYRTRPGQFDNYMKYLRANFAITSQESKRQGLNLGSKVFVKFPNGPNDWDVAIATLYPSYAKALDYSKEDEEKGQAIAAAHFKTQDQEQQAKMTAPRLEMRDYLGTTYTREVTLRPLEAPKK